MDYNARPLGYRGRHRAPLRTLGPVAYYVEGFPGAFWSLVAWLRRPRQSWGWVIAAPLWPVMSALWLTLQLSYGDDWHRRVTAP